MAQNKHPSPPTSASGKKQEQKVAQLNLPLSSLQLEDSLEQNMQLFRQLFDQDGTFLCRTLFRQGEQAPFCALLYCDGLVDSNLMNESIVRPLLCNPPAGDATAQEVLNRLLPVNDGKALQKVEDMVRAITFGDTLLLLEGHKEGLLLNSKGFPVRSIAEPESERILSGPREGFTESIMQNLSMLHRRLRTNALKLKFQSIGRASGTQICLCYLDGVVHPPILQELERRLAGLDIDSVLDSNYLAELVQDSSRSPFRASGTTERPDVVAGKLLEGRIAILVDGSPVALTLPYLFIENFQSNEDYYVNYYYASFSRLLRLLGFFLTVIIPGFYISLICYRHEIIPEQLFIAIASERQSVPFPAPLEAFALLLVFDILREAGVRMPSSIGQALSIVGALVIGQTAVEAKLVASSMLIMVAMTGVCSMLVPKMSAPVVFARAFVLLCASFMGLLGFVCGLCVVAVHILSLDTMGLPQVMPGDLFGPRKSKDLAVRMPWWQMKTRSAGLTANQTRLETPKGKMK